MIEIAMIIPAFLFVLALYIIVYWIIRWKHDMEFVTKRSDDKITMMSKAMQYHNKYGHDATFRKMMGEINEM